MDLTHVVAIEAEGRDELFATFATTNRIAPHWSKA
jgi:hypothetical protein